MKKLILPSLLLLAACNSHRWNKSSYFVWSATYLAWNEDTVTPYKIALFKDNTFLYTTRDTINHKIKTTGYGGYFRWSADTIYLLFKGRTEAPMCDYLVREASGQYLIQYFKDQRKRMFLRRTISPIEMR